MRSKDNENAIQATLPHCRQMLAVVLSVDFQVGDFETYGSLERLVSLTVHQGFAASFRADETSAQLLLLGFASSMNLLGLVTGA